MEGKPDAVRGRAEIERQRRYPAAGPGRCAIIGAPGGDHRPCRAVAGAIPAYSRAPERLAVTGRSRPLLARSPREHGRGARLLITIGGFNSAPTDASPKRPAMPAGDLTEAAE